MTVSSDTLRLISTPQQLETRLGTLEFVEFGVRRGEIRDDVDVEMIASMLDWAAERFQDALGSEELERAGARAALQMEARGERLKRGVAE